MNRPAAAIASIVLVAATTFAAAPTTAPTSPAAPYDAAFLAGDTQTIWDHASPDLRKLLGSPAKLKSFRDAALGDHPVPGPVYTAALDGGGAALTRVATSSTGQPLTIAWAVDPKTSQILVLLVKPAGPATEARSNFLNYQTKATCRLPFDGAWTVAWGGRTLALNYHAAAPDQRFAYDLLVTKDNSTHAGGGSKNEDYYCYGRPILSPADATVLAATDDVPENTPGQMNSEQVMGNHVVLDLGHSEYLFLCHFQPHTLKVKPGDHVTPGQPLALCGNSGHSSEPHLHAHLQTTPTPFRGAGLPLQFQHYTADDKPVDRGEPTRHQVIRTQ